MKSAALLVSTFDEYADVWPAFHYGILKYWNPCPFEIVWTTNHFDAPIGRAVKTDSVTNWTFMTREALITIKQPLFMFGHCDYWITEPPDNDTLFSFIDLMSKHHIDHIQLLPCWDNTVPDGEYPHDDRLLYVHRDSMYRASNQMSLWRTESYLNLLKYGESPWEFEVMGSRRARDMVCLCVKERGCINYVHRSLPEYNLEPVVKGKWTSAAIKYCEQEGIPYSFREGDSVVR